MKKVVEQLVKEMKQEEFGIFEKPNKESLAPASTTAVSVDKDKFLIEQQQSEYTRHLMSLPYESVKDTEAESDWHDIQGIIRGSVSNIPEDKRNIIQKTADKLYESGPIGATAAAVADILPGIPFVDIIDPPHRLQDPQMQTSRNLLAALGIPLSISQAPKVAGRVATNIREPFSYMGSLKTIKDNVMFGGGFGEAAYWAEPSKIKRVGGAIDRTLKSIIKDKPLYESRLPGFVKGAGIPTTSRDRAVYDAREFLYRKTFGLKPRKGKNIFIQNADGSLSFNPQSKRAQILINDIVEGTKGEKMLHGVTRGSQMKTFNPTHGVMGGYSAKIGSRRKLVPSDVPGIPYSHWSEDIIKYEDIWDFKMHPGEWKELFKKTPKTMVGQSPKVLSQQRAFAFENKTALMAQAGLRTLIDVMTTSPVIRGTIAY